MDCFGTYFTHVQSVSEWTASVHTLHMSRVQSATDWTAWVHPSHMSKPNVTRVHSALGLCWEFCSWARSIAVWCFQQLCDPDAVIRPYPQIQLGPATAGSRPKVKSCCAEMVPKNAVEMGPSEEEPAGCRTFGPRGGWGQGPWCAFLIDVTISSHLEVRIVIVKCQAVGFHPCFQHRAGEDKNGFKTWLRKACLTGEDLLATGWIMWPSNVSILARHLATSTWMRPALLVAQLKLSGT